MRHRIVTVIEFKSRCLALLGDISKNGGTITVTRCGRPLASIVPARQPAWKSPEGAWVGRVSVADGSLEGDTSALWEVLRQRRGTPD